MCLTEPTRVIIKLMQKQAGCYVNTVFIYVTHATMYISQSHRKPYLFNYDSQSDKERMSMF